MADISVTANQILSGGPDKAQDGSDLPKILLRLISANTNPPSYYLASGDVTVNGIESVVAGDGIAVDDTDPNNPIISTTGGGSNSIAIFSGGSVSNVRDGKFVGIGRSFNNSVANTDPDAPDFATVINVAGVLKYLGVRLGAAAGDGANTITLYVNGVATDLVVTLAENDVDGFNTINEVSVNPGDLVTLGIESENDNVILNSWACGFFSSVSGGGTGIQSVIQGTGISVDNTDPANPIVSADLVFTQLTGGSKASIDAGDYVGIGRSFDNGSGNANPVNPDFTTFIQADGVLKYFGVFYDGTPSGSSSATVYVNGVASALVATSATSKAYDTTHSVSVVQGDLISISHNADVGMANWSCGFAFNP